VFESRKRHHDNKLISPITYWRYLGPAPLWPLGTSGAPTGNNLSNVYRVRLSSRLDSTGESAGVGPDACSPSPPTRAWRAPCGRESEELLQHSRVSALVTLILHEYDSERVAHLGAQRRAY